MREQNIENVEALLPTQRKVWDKLVDIAGEQGLKPENVVYAFKSEFDDSVTFKRKMLLHQVLRKLGVPNDINW